MKVISLPHHFVRRPYQEASWDAMFKQNKKRLIFLWHRRAGKDKNVMNMFVAASQLRVGNYFYVFPEYAQGRRIIWEGMDKEGFPFLDHFPQDLIEKKDNTRMMLKLKNGSIFSVVGADRARWNNLIGTNPVGLAFSEYAIQTPMGWDFMRPILRENDGWALFAYTPRGMNHGFDLYETNRNNPDWFVQKLTVRDTVKHDGSPVITPEMIAEEHRSGMTKELIQQEFYCSFESPLSGAYFADQLSRATDEGRIENFPIDRGIPVLTFWDLGFTDSTAIWFMQRVHDELHLINYYENALQDIQHYVNYINDYRDKHQMVYGGHYAPHDVKNKDLKSGGLPSWRMFKEAGLTFSNETYGSSGYDRVKNKNLGIEWGRQLFHRLRIHKDNCKQGLSCLRDYHQAYNPITRAYSGQPVRNYATHGVDAYLLMAQLELSRQKRQYQGQPRHQRISDWKVFN